MSKTVRPARSAAKIESRLIHAVHGQRALARIDLARALGLVPSTAGVYVDRLIERGYLLEAAAPVRGPGRPPVLLKINPEAGRFVGVDFDARQVMVALVDMAQQPLRRVRRTIPARATADRVLALIEELLDEIVAAETRELLAFGLGVPGAVDRERGVSLRYEYIRHWHDVAIGPRIASRYDRPVFVENNLRSLALGELWSGQGRGLQDIVCLGIRSGIGTGIVIGGKLLSGAHNFAGEIGSWTCPGVDGGPANGSRLGPTIEHVASLTALLRELAELRNRAGTRTARGRATVSSDRAPTVADLLAAVGAGDREVRQAVHRAARVHGWIVHQLAALIDPERIIVAGPLAESSDYLAMVREAAVELGGAELAPRVVASTLGPFGGALGAAALAFHHWVPAS